MESRSRQEDEGGEYWALSFDSPRDNPDGEVILMKLVIA